MHRNRYVAAIPPDYDYPIIPCIGESSVYIGDTLYSKEMQGTFTVAQLAWDGREWLLYDRRYNEFSLSECEIVSRAGVYDDE